ncbi:MAG: hypothetical protein FJZ87_07505 [Chloroflexi bacterium]|nr:hypothetical protein [Chloroflexota bacterium]
MSKASKTKKTLSRVDRFRMWIKNFASNIFAGPYLPVSLTIFFVLTAVTNLAVVLMSQPLSYWSGADTGTGMDIFGGTLTYGPVTLIALGTGYLIVGILLLSFVNYRWSLVGWVTAEFAHIYFIQQTLNGCYVSRWIPSISEFCKLIKDVGFLMPAVIFIGILLVFSFQPAEFSLANKKAEKRVLSFSGALSIVWVLIMIGGVLWSVRKPSFGWIPVEVKDKPGPLQDGEAAYDSRRNKIVMFGGATGYIGNNQWDYKNDTWEWDGQTWTRMSPDVYPPARLDHALAYDENRGVIVMFGGLGQSGRLSDTWEWDGRTWTEKKSRDHPSPRSGHEMVYDPVRKKVVLYGGYNDPTFYNDAWEWDGTDWKWIDLDADAPAASVFALSYNTDKNFAFGLLSGTPGGTWKWEKDTWTKVYPNHEPSNRSSTTVVYDPTRKLFFTFGGIAGSDPTDDTWTFDGTDWAEYSQGGVHPSARSDMTIWYDPFRKHVMLFGGHNGSTMYNDMWEFIPAEK